MTSFSIHRAALAEIRAAAHWYRARSVLAASGFLDAIEGAIAAITETPEAWPLRGDRVDVRTFTLGRYPFVIVYRLRQPAAIPIRVLAVAHARRNPNYWSRRR